MKLITIEPVPVAGSITGAASVCEGMTIILSDVVPGGVWSSGNTSIATVTGGIVTGVTAGTDTISYSVSNSCGIASAHYSVTVMAPGDCNTGINTLNNNNAELKVYPNPNNGTFSINLLSDRDEPVKITITNVLGVKIADFNTISNKEFMVYLPRQQVFT
jgi:hypothetical protein